MSRIINRRQFIDKGLTVGALMAASHILPANAESKSPNDKLNIACVGTQGRAAGNIKGINSQNLVAICDVDADSLGKRAKELPAARRYRDFRRMLEKEDDKIDAVLVATPDHIHAPATAMALRMGKHVYCEKPLTHTVEEARIIRELAEKNNCVTQMGTQIHSMDNYRRVVELIRAGAIGDVKDVHVWVGSNWSNGRYNKPAKKPVQLDWDLWLGPAKKRKYFEGIHPFHWRRFWEYGGGSLADMACHFMDLVFWALELKHPTVIKADGPPVHADGTPAGLKVDYQYPARGDWPAVNVTWYDGGRQPRMLKQLKDGNGKPLEPKYRGGQLFVGTKGMLLSKYTSHILLPAKKFAEYKAPAPTIPSSPGHHKEWMDACKGKTKIGQPGGPQCHFGYSAILTEAVLLGNVAYRSGKTIYWDAKSLRATNAPEADKFIRKEYRKGWDLVRNAIS